MFTILPERPEHASAVPALLDAAFGPDRLTKRSYHYRRGIAPAPGLAFAALDAAGALVGTIDFWPVRVATGGPALLLGPLAVRHDLKGAGVGRALVREGLERAAARGHRAVFLVGDLAYYARFGFAPAAPRVTMPGEDPARLLATPLAPGGLDRLSGPLLRVDAPAASAVASASAAPTAPA